jgi:hypothetical protein
VLACEGVSWMERREWGPVAGREGRLVGWKGGVTG